MDPGKTDYGTNVESYEAELLEGNSFEQYCHRK